MTSTIPALTNWSGTVTFSAARVHRPTSVEQVQSLVAGSDRVRVLGSAHSFSPIADTTGDLISVADLPSRIEIAPDRRSVTVSGGLRYGAVAIALHAEGLALHNLGSLPHISVAGAVSTGTHGSGDWNANLATAVLAIDLVTADGELHHVNASDSIVENTNDPAIDLNGAVVALGCLGVVTAVTLRTEPTYDMTQGVVEGISPGAVASHLDEVFAAGDSVSIFTGWRHGNPAQVWVKRRVDGARPALADDWLGGHPADGPRHPLPGVAAAACTGQLDVPGPWLERLPHFRLDHTPSSGAELQTEYFVPRADALAALGVVAGLAAHVAPMLLISELRTVAADELWLSPAYQRDCLALHFTWKPDIAAVLPVLHQLESALAPFGARPHWGKVFVMSAPDVQGLYPRLDDFRELRARLDPANHFGNEMVDRYVS